MSIPIYDWAWEDFVKSQFPLMKSATINLTTFEDRVRVDVELKDGKHNIAQFWIGKLRIEPMDSKDA